MISLLLTALMAAVLTLALLMRRRSPAIALAFAAVAAVGTWFAWQPEHLNQLAHAVGVGRGADLALYLGLSLSFLALAALLLQLRHLQNRFTQLAREVALIQARHMKAAESVDVAAYTTAVPNRDRPAHSAHSDNGAHSA